MEIRLILQILYRRRALIATVLGAFLFLVVMVTLLAPKSYVSTAKISIENPDKQSVLISALGLSSTVLGGRVDDDLSMDTDIELTMVKPLVARLISDLDIRDSGGELMNPDDLVDAGFKNKLKGEPTLNIKQYNDSALVSIEVSAETPQRAAIIANTMAMMYIEDRIAGTRMDYREVAEYLEQVMETTRDDYYKKLALSKEFKQKTGSLNVTTDADNLIASIVELERVQASSEREISNFRSIINSATSELARTDRMWESSEELGANDVTSKLRGRMVELSEEIAKRSVSITENHPEYKDLATQMDSVRAMISSEPELTTSRKYYTLNPAYERYYSSIAENLLSLKGALATLGKTKDQIAAYKKRLMEMPGLQMEDSKLRMELDVNSSLYSRALEYSIKLGLGEAVSVSKIRLVEPATPPRKHSFPRKGINLILGMIFGGFMALCAAFAYDYADDSIVGSDGLRRRQGGAYLGAIPCDGMLESAKANAFGLPPGSITLEAFRSLRDSLEHRAGGGKTPAMVSVTSDKTGSGTSTVAAGLARAVAEKYGNTVLVEADFRSQSMAAGASGLSDILAGRAVISDCARTGAAEGLVVITAGAAPQEIGKTLDSEAFASFVQELRASYRHVVMDCAPVGMYNDALACARRSEAVVFVARTLSTTGPSAEVCMERLAASSAGALCTVLNADGYSIPIRRVPAILRSGIKSLPKRIRQAFGR